MMRYHERISTSGVNLVHLYGLLLLGYMVTVLTSDKTLHLIVISL